MVGFDNLRSLSGEISDGLCRLSTGLSDSQRLYYTNDEEIIYTVKGPAIINSKNDGLAKAEDLANRMLGIHLTPLEGRTKECAQLKGEFNTVHAQILGALLDVAVEAIRNRDRVRQEQHTLHRLADFDVWIRAAEPALVADPALGWQPDTFAKMLQGNQKEMGRQALESNPFIDAMLRFLLSNQSHNCMLHGRFMEKGTYHGTIGNLLYDETTSPKRRAPTPTIPVWGGRNSRRR